MNERIKELLKQAVIAVDDPFPGNPLNDELAKMYIPDCFAEKFAELIVDECVSIVNAGKIVWVSTDFPVSGEVALDLCAKDIKSYFGVEE